MNKIKLLLTGISLLLILTNGCSNPTESNKTDFDKITRTMRDNTGGLVVISYDPLDWQIDLSPLPDFIIEDSGPFSTFIWPAYPNPSSDSVSIRFSLSMETNVHFEIINENRNVVRTLIDESRIAGYHVINWNLDDDRGNKVEKGFYRCSYSWQAIVYEKGSNYTRSQLVQVSGYGDIQVE